MPLDEYIKKRDFKNTPEPIAELGEDKEVHRFVIQRHDARALHYDLRLEMKGVLKSWAVPKGPSQNPSDKRLAIMTEDHPVKYLQFEGIIPKGNYGAGEMHIWDTGVYQSTINDPLEKQLKDGNIKLLFSGKHIKGEFALVRTRQGDDKNQWLLIKKKDKYAVETDYDAEEIKVKKLFPEKPLKPKSKKAKTKVIKLKDSIKPMLATRSSKIFDSPDWIYEIKWDGYRTLTNIKDGELNMYSRNGNNFNSKFSSIAKELENLNQNVLLDGEVVAVDNKGMPNFQALQNYEEGGNYELRYYVFDLLHLNGHDLSDIPLVERKSLLPEILNGLEKTLYCEHIKGMGSAFFETTRARGLEGVIAKKSNSRYIPGNRSKDWLKFKTDESIEAIICGYTDSDAQAFGSLILGLIEDGKLSYIGNVGTGFTDKSQKEILKKLKPLKRKTSPFKAKLSLKGRKPTWVRPELICEVKFTEWTKGDNLRHPVYKGLRGDKEKEELQREEEITEPDMEETGGNKLLLNNINVPISNPDKIYWPDEGLRKFDLIDYYIKVSDVMLPYLKDRPQNLNRHPNGIKKPGFFQKDSNGQMPDWMETIRITSKSNKKDIEYVLCQKEADLIYLANLGCIEINPWSSRKGSLKHPDWTVIDIDPSDKNTFEQVIEVALAAEEVIDKVKIKAFPKTSGSSGIHIYIPMGAQYTYSEARNFTKLLCQFILHKLPDLCSMERSPSKRKGKIYLDFMQNSKGQTLAAPYCLRPKAGATASAPLKWEELKPGLDMKDFNIHTMPARIEEMGDLFKGVLGKGIDMEKALEELVDS